MFREGKFKNKPEIADIYFYTMLHLVFFMHLIDYCLAIFVGLHLWHFAKLEHVLQAAAGGLLAVSKI